MAEQCPTCQQDMVIPSLRKSRRAVIGIAITALALLLVAAGISVTMSSASAGAEIRPLVGTGKPFRPKASGIGIVQLNGRGMTWQDMVTESSLDEIVGVIESRGNLVERQIYAGMSPWVATLDRLATTRCVAGGVIVAKRAASWNFDSAFHRLSAPKLDPAWELLTEPISESELIPDGTFSDRRSSLATMTVIARVPDSLPTGGVLLSLACEPVGAKRKPDFISPPSFQLVIEDAPHPDRETLLSFFGCVILEPAMTKKDGESFPDQHRLREGKIALQAAILLPRLNKEMDGGLQTLGREILNHPAYKDAVIFLQKREARLSGHTDRKKSE